ncbi:MAG: MDR family oxidoreductase [Chloroflexota bacterium]
MSFRAMLLTHNDDRSISADLTDLNHDDLMDGDVLVRVAYSSLNYKDGLAVTGKGKVIRNFPMIPGIDFVGTVEESASEDYQPGDQVILTGWGVGEKHYGGYAQYARVQSEWLVPLPEKLSPQHAMAMGTAGLTAMLAVRAQEVHGLQPEHGDILVTGASGGTGSMAIAILGGWGYNVVASTGRAEEADYLRSLGANEVIGRLDSPGRPLESGRWGAVVDGVGGATLASALAATKYGGCVAAYGLAGGTELNTTVLPFILRGIKLHGIDSVMAPFEKRKDAWMRLALDVPTEKLDTITQVVPLSEIRPYCDDILAGKVRGRIVVDVNG